MTLSASVSLEASTSAPGLGGVLYRFMVFPFPPSHFTVRSFKGRESLSGLYGFDVVVTGLDLGDGAIERLALGQRALLILRAGKAPRAFHGIVASVRHQGVRAANGVSQYRIRLVPALWLLRHRRRSRIFQNLRVDQTLEAVLREAHIAVRFELGRDYPVREYTTQYEETDLRFLQRLAAEAGLFFRFAHPPPLAEEAIAAASDALGGVAGAALGAVAGAAFSALFPKETVVFADDASFYPPIDDGSLLGAAAEALGVPTSGSTEIAGMSVSAGLASPTLHHLSVEGTSTDAFDKVTRFEPTHRVRTNAAMYREYDPERPLAMITTRAALGDDKREGLAGSVSASVSLSPDAGFRASASVDVAGALVGALGPLLDAPALEHYEHHAPFLFSKWRYAEDEPTVALRRKRRDARTARGESTCPALAAGHRFRLEDHPASHLNRDHVVTEVEHEGWATPQEGRREVYRNTFSCAPAEVTLCPPRPRRRSATVALTATVAGPANEEIHTDALGRIKVQFHWDREGKSNEQSSCWIRTMHAWGGAGWGTQFIPRVGMEVVVTFDGGDPDKPMILGCLYNGTHPPSFRLPEQKTRSGIRTQTSPGGRGFNELSFEDRAGAEQIYIHARRDLDEVVERNHTLAVVGDEAIRVSGTRSEEIRRDARLLVEGDLDEAVKGDRRSEVKGNRLEATEGGAEVRVSGDLVTRVEGRERREIVGTTDLVHEEDLTIKVRGCETVLVGRHGAERSYLVHVEGVGTLTATRGMEIASDKELVFRCGKSAVRLTAEGIELDAPSLSIKGGASRVSLADEGLEMKSRGAEAKLTEDSVLVRTERGASLAMGKEVKVDGAQILLNSPERARDPAPESPGPKTTIELVDQDGKPLAYQRYLLLLEDGSEQSGMLDEDGRAEVDARVSGKIVFPDLDGAEPA